MANLNPIAAHGPKDVAVASFKAQLDASVLAGGLGSAFVTATKTWLDAVLTGLAATTPVKLVLEGIEQTNLKARYQINIDY